MTFDQAPSHPALVAKRDELKAEVDANGNNTPLAKSLTDETAELLKTCSREAGYF